MAEPIDRRTFLRTGLGLTGALAVGACTTSPRSTARRAPSQALAVFVSAADLAEADRPAVEIAAFGSSYWKPGPERLYGYALRDLAEYLGKVTGDLYPLTAADAVGGGGVYAGTFGQFQGFVARQPASAQALSSSDPEAFVVEGQGDKLFVLGKTRLGLIAATYTLLDALGCRWFAPGPEWESVPHGGHLSTDQLQMASAGPSYHARFFFSSFGANFSVFDEGRRDRLYLLWNLRNRMGGSQYVSNSHHAPIIPATLFSTRPELFAQAEGKRVPYELARGNPEAVAMATDIAVNYLRDNAGKGSYFDSFSAEPNDGVPADEESLARIGNHTATDLDFWFANQVAAGIEKADLTDKSVGILSYSDHASIPSFDLHPQVSVQVATDLDFTSKMTVEQRLDGFRQRNAKRLGIYEYLNLIIWSSDRPGVSPSAKPAEVAANLKRWHDHGARTYTAETSDSW
nr:twin-arginine translocation signal domain-containing protein [Acidimicrobiia bacterium]